MFALILILGGGYKDTSPAITHISGFKTMSGCKSAGVLYINVAQKNYTVDAICVELK